LGLLTIVSSFFFSYFLYNLLRTSQGSLALVFLALVFFSVFFVLQGFLISRTNFLHAFLLLESLVLFLPLLTVLPWTFSLAGFVITALFFNYATWSSRLFASKLLKISFFKVGSLLMSRLITGLAFFIVLTYMGLSLTGSISLVSENIFGWVLNPSASLVQNFYPSFTLDKSLRSNFTDIAESQLSALPEWPTLTDSEQRLLVERRASGYESSLFASFGGLIDVSKTTTEAIYQSLSQRLDDLLSSTGWLGYALIILVLVFILRSISPVFSWPVLLLTFLLYQTLQALGWFIVVYESKSQEIIVMS